MTSLKVIYFASLFVAVILHEVSHGVMALFYGDDTAKRAGRITLNPISHVDLFGSIILPAMAVLANLPVLGWAKPVPVNPNKLRDPRRQMVFVGLVGPATNFALMLAAAFAARTLYQDSDFGSVFLFLDTQTLGFQVLYLFALVNMFLGIFNLLPIPPLDGSALIERVLPARYLPTWWKIRPYGFLVLFIGLFYIDFLPAIVEPFDNALREFVVS